MSLNLYENTQHHFFTVTPTPASYLTPTPLSHILAIIHHLLKPQSISESGSVSFTKYDKVRNPPPKSETSSTKKPTGVLFPNSFCHLMYQTKPVSKTLWFVRAETMSITHTGEPVLTTQQPSGTHTQADPAQCPASAAGRTGSVSVPHAGCSVPKSRT